MRRRNLLENAAKLTLTWETITVEPYSSLFSFGAYWNGAKIASSSTLSVTYDGTVITSKTISSDGTISARYAKYTGTTNNRSGYVEVTYSGQTARLDVIQKKDYIYNSSDSTTTIVTSYFTSIDGITNVRVIYDCESTAETRVLVSSGNVKPVTLTTVTRTNYYKSGRNTQSVISNSESSGSTSTVSNQYITSIQNRSSVLGWQQYAGDTKTITIGKHNNGKYSVAASLTITITLNEDWPTGSAGGKSASSTLKYTFNGSTKTNNNGEFITIANPC